MWLLVLWHLLHMLSSDNRGRIVWQVLEYLCYELLLCTVHVTECGLSASFPTHICKACTLWRGHHWVNQITRKAELGGHYAFVVYFDCNRSTGFGKKFFVYLHITDGNFNILHDQYVSYAQNCDVLWRHYISWYIYIINQRYHLQLPQ